MIVLEGGVLILSLTINLKLPITMGYICKPI